MLNAQLCTQKTQIRTTTTHRPLETNTCQTTKPTRHAKTKQSLQKININATIAHLRARTTNGKPQKQSNQAQTQPPAQNINTETRTANTRPKIKSKKTNGQSNHQSRTTEHTNNMNTKNSERQYFAVKGCQSMHADRAASTSPTTRAQQPVKSSSSCRNWYFVSPYTFGGPQHSNYDYE